MIYKWKSKSMVSVDAQKAGDHLEALRANHGLLDVDIVLKDARKKRSPIHNAFEWDNDAAAEGYRRQQAGYLIRSLVVVDITDKEDATPIRAFVNVIQNDQQGYTSIVHAMSDKELRVQILQNAWKELESFRDKYKEYEELSILFSAMDKAKKKAA